MNPKIKEIINFIETTVKDSGFNRLIIGLSGGIDSAVVASLSVKAIGKENVIGVMMPYITSNPDSLAHAKLLATGLNIQYFINPITDMVDSYFDKFEPNATPLRKGNYMARTRMCILYDLSAKHNALVVGTSNFSEIYVGYCTQYGDSACAFEPIAHLLKTQVYEIASDLNIPPEIINKKPSADLWNGQTDEQELGITYKTLDKILRLMFFENKNKDEIMEQGIPENEYNLVMKKVKGSEFKRRMPLIMSYEL